MAKPMHADLRHVLEWAGVDARLQNFVRDCGEDGFPARWKDIRESTIAKIRASLGDRASVEDDHVMAYIQIVVAAEVVRTSKDVPVPDDQRRRLEIALEEFYRRYLKSDGEPLDYAHGLSDVKDRVLFGSKVTRHLSPEQLKAWEADIDVFSARVQRHEYSWDVAIRVLEEVKAGLQERKAEIGQEIARLQSVVARYSAGPAHVYALEQQWTAYKFNSFILRRERDLRGALQPATCEALRVAETYCWSPSTVEAVAGVAAGMPGECALTPASLGDLSVPARAGWWWFQEPLRIKTTESGADAEPVVAMLWRREAHPQHGLRVWFQAFVQIVATENGRPVSAPAPTVAWTWEDGRPLGDLPSRLRSGFQGVTVGGRQVEGYQSADVDETIEAALWFSRFFLAGAMWLRQRIVTPVAGEGARPAGRRIQREHQLQERPRVQVIELRRAERQMVQRARAAGAERGETTGRKLGVRFVVGGLFGFTRNQWHPSTSTHVPTWISPFWKGPDDAPVKQSARVYVVRR